MVGQSGSGKSTIAKILTQLERATSGEVLLNGSPSPSVVKGCAPTGNSSGWSSRTRSRR
ncbi:ATP-binding cassette domain-containing protein [Tessaracoccus coleopterorum]